MADAHGVDELEPCEDLCRQGAGPAPLGTWLVWEQAAALGGSGGLPLLFARWRRRAHPQEDDPRVRGRHAAALSEDLCEVAPVELGHNQVCPRAPHVCAPREWEPSSISRGGLSVGPAVQARHAASGCRSPLTEEVLVELQQRGVVERLHHLDFPEHRFEMRGVPPVPVLVLDAGRTRRLPRGVVIQRIADVPEAPHALRCEGRDNARKKKSEGCRPPLLGPRMGVRTQYGPRRAGSVCCVHRDMVLRILLFNSTVSGPPQGRTTSFIVLSRKFDSSFIRITLTATCERGNGGGCQSREAASEQHHDPPIETRPRQSNEPFRRGWPTITWRHAQSYGGSHEVSPECGRDTARASRPVDLCTPVRTTE